MTWLQLYNLLHDRANTMSKLGTVKWNDDIIVHNAETGEESTVDIWELSGGSNNDSRLTLVYNQLEYESKGDNE